MSSTILMVIMICVGLAAALAGLIYLVIRGVKLAGTAKHIVDDATPQVQSVTRRVEELTPRLEVTAAKQKELAERLQALSAANERLNYLREQLEGATYGIFKLKS